MLREIRFVRFKQNRSAPEFVFMYDIGLNLSTCPNHFVHPNLSKWRHAP